MRTADQILAGLVPPSQLSARRHDGPLPLAATLLPTLSDGSLVYAISRADESGVVAAAHVLDRLDWRTGDRLAVTTVRNIVIIRRKRDGLQVVPKRRLPAERVAEINQTASTTGNDPELDALLRFHEETAARRGGALALRTPHDIDTEQRLVHLHEKGETVRWQPVSPTPKAYLQVHAEQRNVPSGGQLFRYRNGKPLTGRRYDHLWTRLGRHLPWVAAQQVTIHWLRYTTLTWVERNFSYAIARAYAGHFETNGTVGTTATYVRAGTHEVATALAALTREPHPIARPDTRGSTPNFDMIGGAGTV